MTLRSADEPLASAPIRRATLHEQVAERLRDMIIEGILEPGERINETHLIVELGVSRTPMREALRTLAAEHLVEIRPARGAVVRKLSPTEVYSMLEFLAEVEALAGRFLCERASDTEIAAILAKHDEMMELYAARDRLVYYKANQEIHAMIAAGARNPALEEAHRSIQSRLKRIRFIGNRHPDKWACAVAEHERMADALKGRDADALSAVIRLHIMATWDRVRDVV